MMRNVRESLGVKVGNVKECYQMFRIDNPEILNKDGGRR